MEKPDNTLTMWWELPLVIRADKLVCLQKGYPEEDTISLFGFLALRAYSEPNYKEKSDKPKLRDSMK